MPIHEADPWRHQYFQDIACPADVHIATDDPTAFFIHPQHRWVYDKLLVAQSQGLACAVQDSPPSRFPVFSKPITNLRGMGVGSRPLRSLYDYRKYCKTGDFWMSQLSGDHLSTDWAVVDGEPRWCRHAQGIGGPGGTFDYWIIEARARPALEHYSRDWIRRNLAGYTGMLNLETIGGFIIEVHLRFTDQWPDLYGRDWINAVVRLYQHGEWNYSDSPRADQYSVVLFGPHGIPYVHSSAAREAEYRSVPGVSSVQITFHRHLPHSAHAMPPGGFRLAIINCSAPEVGFRVRAIMARDFGVPDLELQRRLAG